MRKVGSRRTRERAEMRDKVRDENKNREELKHLMFFLSLIGLGEEVVGYRKEIETTLAFVLWGFFQVVD